MKTAKTALKIVFSAALIAMASVAFAAATSPLGRVMIQMAADYKLLQGSLSAAGDTAQTLKLVQDFKGLVTSAREILPEKALNDAVEKADYQQKMDDLSAEADQIATAVSQGDFKAAQAAFAKMSQTKSDGHDRFKD